MYSQQIADLDHHMPKDIVEKTFKVCDYSVCNGRVTIIDILDQTFPTEAEAKAAIFALTDYNGEELTVVEFQEDGDEMCVFSGVWDEEQNKYVEA